MFGRSWGAETEALTSVSGVLASRRWGGDTPTGSYFFPHEFIDLNPPFPSRWEKKLFVHRERATLSVLIWRFYAVAALCSVFVSAYRLRGKYLRVRRCQFVRKADAVQPPRSDSSRRIDPPGPLPRHQLGAAAWVSEAHRTCLELSSGAGASPTAPFTPPTRLLL